MENKMLERNKEQFTEWWENAILVLMNAQSPPNTFQHQW